MTRQEDSDRQHLEMIVIFHYVSGILGVLTACLPLIHFGMGVAILNGQFPQGNAAGPAFPTFFGLVFAVIGGGMFVVGQLTAWATIYSAGLIRRRRGRGVSLVVAGIQCAAFPLGTALGVFTIIVLSRDSVKALYEEAEYYD